MLTELRSAADRSGMPVEDWLVQLLVEGVAKVYAERPADLDTGLAGLQAVAIDEDW